MMEMWPASNLGSLSLVCSDIPVHSATLLIKQWFVGAQTFSNARYGQGTGLIHLGGLQCTGSEIRLANCTRGSTAGCTHGDDAGLACNISKS